MYVVAIFFMEQTHIINATISKPYDTKFFTALTIAVSLLHVHCWYRPNYLTSLYDYISSKNVMSW